MRRIPVLFFLPNIIDYFRIALLLLLIPLLSPLSSSSSSSFLSAVAISNNPWPAVAVYLLSFALDGVDGMIARRLNQVCACVHSFAQCTLEKCSSRVQRAQNQQVTMACSHALQAR